MWLILGTLLAAAELFTATTFILLMFAAGAFAAAATAALGAPAVAQGAVFALVSVLALFAVRPVIRRHLTDTASDRRVGLEALQGASGLVLERVDVDKGLIKLDGETWLARAYDATEAFEPGERVRIIEFKGATALVWRD